MGSQNRKGNNNNRNNLNPPLSKPINTYVWGHGFTEPVFQNSFKKIFIRIKKITILYIICFLSKIFFENLKISS